MRRGEATPALPLEGPPWAKCCPERGASIVPWHRVHRQVTLSELAAK